MYCLFLKMKNFIFGAPFRAIRCNPRQRPGISAAIPGACRLARAQTAVDTATGTKHRSFCLHHGPGQWLNSVLFFQDEKEIGLEPSLAETSILKTGRCRMKTSLRAKPAFPAKKEKFFF
jgi:hypothetical protein